MAKNPAEYYSRPQSMELASQTMRQIKEGEAQDADGNFPAAYAQIQWDAMNLPSPDTSWQT